MLSEVQLISFWHGMSERTVGTLYGIKSAIQQRCACEMVLFLMEVEWLLVKIYKKFIMIFHNSDNKTATTEAQHPTGEL